MEKLRVLIVNKFFYPRGGDCNVAIQEEKLLRASGIETAVFTMEYPENITPEGIRIYTAPRVKFDGGIIDKIKATRRILGGGVGSSFRAVLKDFNPDIVHFHNIHSYLSPAIVAMAKKFGAKTVWTMHDYKLICPSYSMLRNGKVCEECLSDPSALTRHNCHKGSPLASRLAAMEASKWNSAFLCSVTDAFIAPSSFMKRMLVRGGYPEEKIHVITNCVDPGKLVPMEKIEKMRGDYYVYAGRLSPEKGLTTLLSAAIEIPKVLNIYGGGPLMGSLKTEAAGYPQIVFHGHCGGKDIIKALVGAKLSVCPSEWYENNPLSIIESLCAGTPVIGTDIGGIPELIGTGDGIIVPPGDSVVLEEKLRDALSSRWDNERIAMEARKRFSPNLHTERIKELYKNLQN